MSIVSLNAEALNWCSLIVCLVEWILGRMERKWEKISREAFQKVFGWERERKKRVGPMCFFLRPTKTLSPYNGEKIWGGGEGKLNMSWPKCPCVQYTCAVLNFFFFFFFYSFFFLGTSSVFFFFFLVWLFLYFSIVFYFYFMLIFLWLVLFKFFFWSVHTKCF